MKLVLVIDDDDDMQALLERQLTERGFRVAGEKNPARGLELARTGNPDFILLDIDMPGMTGIEVLEELRKNEITRDTPVIMLTAHDDEQLVRRCLEFGITDYLIKPHSADNLARKIQAALEWNSINSVQGDDTVPPIITTRSGGRLEIRFRDNPAQQDVLAEADRMFGPDFHDRTKGDPCVIDLRNLSEMSEQDLAALKGILGTFADRQVHLVSGRHYGQIMKVIEEKDGLPVKNFLSPEEVDRYLARDPG